MSGKPIDNITLESLHFFGVISASFSHEINNVVSIIKELSGLVSDYMAAAENGRPLDPDKLRDKNNKIIETTRRGDAIIKNFNRFAHSADKAIQPVDLDALLDNFISVTQRIAGLKGVTIVLADKGTDEKVCECNPFLVMNVLFLVVKDIIERSDNGAEIELSVSAGGGEFRIIIRSDALFGAGDVPGGLLGVAGVSMEAGETADGRSTTVLLLHG